MESTSLPILSALRALCILNRAPHRPASKLARRCALAALSALLFTADCTDSQTGEGGASGGGTGGQSGAATGGSVGGSGTAGNGGSGAGTGGSTTGGSGGTGAGGTGGASTGGAGGGGGAAGSSGKSGGAGAGGMGGNGGGGAAGSGGKAGSSGAGGNAGSAGSTGGAAGMGGDKADAAIDAGPRDVSLDATSNDAGGGDGGSTGCQSSTWTVGDTNGTLSFGGQSRTYLLHVPSGYTGTTPVPLVLDFHGLGSTASGQRSSSGWLTLSNQDGFILVHPQGVGNSWNLMSGAGGCCPPAFDQNIDDVGFVRALIDKLKGEGCVDPKRIYSTGMSNGGGMTIRLACEAADVIAAIAPNAFDLIQNQPCTPSRPITMIDYRGTADNLVPYNGGTTTIPGDTRQVTFLGASATFEKIRTLSGCTGAPQPTNGNCSTYSTCNQGVQTTLCSVQGGGHSPGDASIGWSVIKNYALP